MPKSLRQIRVEGDVAFVPLTQGYEAIIDAADVSLVEGFNWCAIVVRRSDGSILNVYASRSTRSERKTTVLMHRVIAETPDGLDTDHKDGDGLNNRRSNLRNATKSQNHHNTRTPIHNSSGVKGVRWNKRDRRWVARIVLCGKHIHLGSFAKMDDAVSAYAEASHKLHGEFGRRA